MYPDGDRLNTIIHEPVIKTDSLTDGVIVPGLQCLITALLAGMTAGILAALLEGNGWRWFAGTFSVTALLSWLAYRQGWNNRLERLLGIDLNRNGVIGGDPPPAPAVEPVRVVLEQDNGHHIEYIDLPCKDKLPTFAAGILAGRVFSQTAWTGSAGIFSRSEFDTLRDTMIERGLASWKNASAPAQGVTLTAAGRAVLRRLAGVSPTLPER